MTNCRIPYTFDDRISGCKTGIVTDCKHLGAEGTVVARPVTKTLPDAMRWPELDKAGSVGGLANADNFGHADRLALMDR